MSGGVYRLCDVCGIRIYMKYAKPERRSGDVNVLACSRVCELKSECLFDGTCPFCRRDTSYEVCGCVRAYADKHPEQCEPTFMPRRSFK